MIMLGCDDKDATARAPAPAQRPPASVPGKQKQTIKDDPVESFKKFAHEFVAKTQQLMEADKAATSSFYWPKDAPIAFGVKKTDPTVSPYVGMLT